MIRGAIRILVLGSVFASGSAAALMVDQSQTNTSILQSGVNNSSGKLQGFQPSVTNVAGGGFYFGRVPGSSVAMTIAVWNGLPGTGSQIANGSATLSGIGWLDAFWTPVSVTPGATYYLAVTTSGFPPANDEPAVNSDGSGLYANGSPYSFNPTNNIFENGGNPLPGFDFAFRTYYETPAAVPLPAAAWLMFSGLAGIGVLGRRRKAA